jgi:hypothetical protein
MVVSFVDQIPEQFKLKEFDGQPHNPYKVLEEHCKVYQFSDKSVAALAHNSRGIDRFGKKYPVGGDTKMASGGSRQKTW